MMYMCWVSFVSLQFDILPSIEIVSRLHSNETQMLRWVDWHFYQYLICQYDCAVPQLRKLRQQRYTVANCYVELICGCNKINEIKVLVFLYNTRVTAISIRIAFQCLYQYAVKNIFCTHCSIVDATLLIVLSTDLFHNMHGGLYFIRKTISISHWHILQWQENEQFVHVWNKGKSHALRCNSSPPPPPPPPLTNM